MPVEPTTFNLHVNGRALAFDMLLDKSFIADVNTLLYFKENNGCEPELLQLMVRVLREGDIAVDVGANIGFFTLAMAKLVGTNGRVVAVEPGSNNLDKLKDNIKCSKLRNVQVIEKPLWSKAEQVKLHLSQDSGLNCLERSQFSLGVAKMTAAVLDDLLHNFIVRLLKIDAEGSEYDILVGGGHVLHPDRIPYVVVELNLDALKRFLTTPMAVRQLMETMGYTTFVLHDEGGFPTLVPTTVEIESDYQNTNVLFSTLEHVAKVWPKARVQ